ncbi:MAG: undecaprenyl-diphosphate phosphatase [Planctomycetota bacterium]
MVPPAVFSSAIQEPAAVAANAAAEGPGTAGALILGLVEGLTEFLPVSSTGHLIVTNRFLGQSDPTYEVAIQAGAITAIAVLYWRRLLDALTTVFAGSASTGRVNLLVLLVVGAVPAAVLGLFLDDLIESVLFGAATVATTMVLGGVLLLVLESWLARRDRSGTDAGVELDQMSLRHALWIGVFQCLALIPGTSRSGATIAGAMVVGLRRTAAAEFSFLVGLPILYGACALKAMKDWERISGPLLVDFLIGAGASFVTALVIVGPFVRYLKRHTFRPFAYYRIVAGLALAALIAAGRIPAG